MTCTVVYFADFRTWNVIQINVANLHKLSKARHYWANVAYMQQFITGSTKVRERKCHQNPSSISQTNIFTNY